MLEKTIEISERIDEIMPVVNSRLAIEPDGLSLTDIKLLNLLMCELHFLMFLLIGEHGDDLWFQKLIEDAPLPKIIAESGIQGVCK